MHQQWSCPDDNPAPREYPLPVPGSDEEFPDCPGYYLRTVDMGMPADHLIDGVIHPARLVSEWAMEIESGARSVETLAPKARDLVHVWLRQKGQRDDYDRKQLEAKR